ncbi:class III signal peptide-containing protein [Methanobrevibacter sp. DSM 116169]|uniref:class III signal peptide-containing protein n=1 Tax=Methanobrevibacter sp. DSM 116169 TaxID=3242727 RepID=UPI0038FCA77D
MIKKFLNDKNGQGAAEMILLFGGIILIVIIAIFIYRNYLNEFTNEINSTEVNNFNNKVEDIIKYLNY